MKQELLNKVTETDNRLRTYVTVRGLNSYEPIKYWKGVCFL